MFSKITYFSFILLIINALISKCYGSEDTENPEGPECKTDTLSLKDKEGINIKVNGCGYNITHPVGYTLMCIKKGYNDTGLHFYNDDENGWKLETFGDDKTVEAHLSSYNSCTEVQSAYDGFINDWYCDIGYPGQELQIQEDKPITWKNNQCASLCSSSQFMYLNSTNPINIDCPGKYHVICIRKGNQGTGLHFSKNNNNIWQLKTYGDDKTVEIYIRAHNICTSAQKNLDETTENWQCDISGPGQELQVQEGKGRSWKNDQCASLCDSSQFPSVSSSNPVNIDCPGKYHVICIGKGNQGTGIRFSKNNGIWQLTTYGDNKTVGTYIHAHDTCTSAQNNLDDTTSNWQCDISSPGQELQVEENKPREWKNDQCASLCNGSRFINVNSNSTSVECPGNYHVICIKKGNQGTGLHFYKDKENGWKLKTYGDDKTVEAYIHGHDSCSSAQKNLDETTENWQCDISPGQELQVQEGKGRSWRNDQCASLCNGSQFVDVNRSNPIKIDCPGKYHVICIGKGNQGTGLRFSKNNGILQLTTYGDNKTVRAYIRGHDTCSSAQKNLDETTDNWQCDISVPGQELQVEEGKERSWKSDQCASLCNGSQFPSVSSSNPVNIECPGKFHVICIRKGNQGTGLHFRNNNGVWQLTTYGDNKSVETYIRAHDTCSSAQKNLDETTENWQCDISSPGQELQIQEGKDRSWKNDQCASLCNGSQFVDVNRSNPISIECPGKYHVICIGKGNQSTGLHFRNNNGIWQLTTYGDNKTVRAYIRGHNTCSSAQKNLDETTDNWQCDISGIGQELQIQEGKGRSWKNYQCASLCNGSQFVDVNRSNPVSIECPGNYHVICIKRGYQGTGLRFSKNNGIWQLTTYGDNKTVEAYIRGHETCTSAQINYSETSSNWYCDISSPGQEIQVQEGKPIVWNNNKCSGTIKEAIDISHHNTINDFNKVAKAVDAVIIRAGYRGYGDGVLHKDTKLDAFYNGFKGKTKIGYYIYSQAINVREAREEADAVHNYIKDKAKPDLPIFWDTENTEHNGRADKINVNTRTECGIAFINRIKELGYKPGVYSNEYWFKNNLNFERIVATGASIWVANYSKKPTTRVCDAWQYTEKGSIDGISGNVDRNHVYNW